MKDSVYLCQLLTTPTPPNCSPPDPRAEDGSVCQYAGSILLMKEQNLEVIYPGFLEVNGDLWELSYGLI